MRRKLIGVALAAALVGGAVGVAAASIPDSQGIIHGCYKTNNPNRGQVVVVDTDAGQNCPTGYTALNWNQTGPQGPAGGISGLERVQVDGSGTVPNGEGLQVTATCPSGKVVVSGGFRLSGIPTLTLLRESWRDIQPQPMNAWEVQVINLTGEARPASNLTVYAHCATAN